MSSVVSKLDPKFRLEVAEALERRDFYKCFQCGVCTSSCPVADVMDIKPYQVIKMVLLGMREEALKCGAIWTCSTCFTCDERCPQGVKPREVMEALKQMVIRENGNVAKSKASYTYYKTFMENMRSYGRIHETGFFAKYKLKATRGLGLLGYAPFGLKLLMKGKIALKPHKIHRLEEFKQMFNKVEEVEGKR
ncbi:MAG: 4Fe-4S dicluster domain-containing protein [Candidatus Bathyarchaeia archaeon]